MEKKPKITFFHLLPLLLALLVLGLAILNVQMKKQKAIEETQKVYNELSELFDVLTSPAPDSPNTNELTIIPGENNMIDPLIPALDELFADVEYTARVEANKIVARVTVPDIAATAAAAEDSGDVSAWLELLDKYTEYNNSVVAIAAENSINYPAVLYGIDAEENIYFTISGNSIAYTAVDVNPKSSANPEDYNVGMRGEPTLGEQNALERAKDYLDYSHFSYEGLIDQLEYEKFSHEEAVYGAANCGADWYEQAYQTALDYLDYSAYSRDRLIDQLEYEGFTTSEAEYAADMVGY